MIKKLSLFFLALALTAFASGCKGQEMTANPGISITEAPKAVQQTTENTEKTTPASETSTGDTVSIETTEKTSEAETTTQPLVTTTAPPVTTSQPPITTTAPPVTTTQPPVTTTQPPVTTTQPPVTTTQPPVTTTQPPVTTTQPPVTTTQPPVTTTQPPVTTTAPPEPVILSQEGKERMLELVNNAREENGLSPLVLDDTADEIAQIRAEELLQYYSHTRPDGSSSMDMFNERGIFYGSFGENIAYGLNMMSTVEDVFNAWMNSEGHRANILNPDYTCLGAGMYLVTAPEGTYCYWCQEFAVYY